MKNFVRSLVSVVMAMSGLIVIIPTDRHAGSHYMASVIGGQISA